MNYEEFMQRPLHVLIVEDSPQMAEFLCHALPSVDRNLTVEAVGSLAQAVIRLSRDGVNVVLLDLLLPDAEDIQAVCKIQKTFPEMPVVVLSAMGSDVEKDALEAGAEDFIPKGGPDSTPTSIVRSIRHAVIRHEVHLRFRQAQQSLESTARAIEKAEALEKLAGVK